MVATTLMQAALRREVALEAQVVVFNSLRCNLLMPEPLGW